VPGHVANPEQSQIVPGHFAAGPQKLKFIPTPSETRFRMYLGRGTGVAVY